MVRNITERDAGETLTGAVAQKFLSDEVLPFVAELDRRFHGRRGDLVDRRIEITGPTDAKTVINALNPRARVFMADVEDATTPTWTNLVEGQLNLASATRRGLRLVTPDGRIYQLSPESATLMVRPLGWHLDERGVAVDGHAVAGALFDFGASGRVDAADRLFRELALARALPSSSPSQPWICSKTAPLPAGRSWWMATMHMFSRRPTCTVSAPARSTSFPESTPIASTTTDRTRRAHS